MWRFLPTQFWFEFSSAPFIFEFGTLLVEGENEGEGDGEIERERSRETERKQDEQVIWANEHEHFVIIFITSHRYSAFYHII